MSYARIVKAINNLTRDDLQIKSVDVNAGGAGDNEVLAAVAGQVHKIYAYGYESDGNIEVGFRFGTGDKWGRRWTAGPFAQTLFRPIVGPLNTALNFRVEGAVNAKVWIQYKTEEEGYQ
jgi:hypothetical protein